MILKIARQKDYDHRPWYLRDKIDRVSWGYRPKEEFDPEAYCFHAISDDPGETSYCECCVRFKGSLEEILMAFSDGYLLNDDGKTIERL